jgi:hypothetical protein
LPHHFKRQGRFHFVPISSTKTSLKVDCQTKPAISCKVDDTGIDRD